MTKALEAIYKLNHTWINEFSFLDQRDSEAELNYSFIPSGIFNPEENDYFITLQLTVSTPKVEALAEDEEDGEEDEEMTDDEDEEMTDDEDEDGGVEFLKLSLAASVTIMEGLEFEEIPTDFFDHIIDVLFPFLRGFLFGTTQLANIDPIIIPEMAMKNSGAILRENTLVVGEDL